MPSDSNLQSEVIASKPKDTTRGLIEVEFVAKATSGVEAWNFDDEQRKELSEDWTPKLREILERSHLVSWRPSFPLLYPWSPQGSKESALDSYLKAGRHKFVTFKFPVGADVVRIARELMALPEIDQAVSVPQLRPPHHMPTEP